MDLLLSRPVLDRPFVNVTSELPGKKENIVDRRTLWAGVAVVLLIAVAALIFLLRDSRQFNGVVIDPPLPAEEIRLTDHNGQPFLLSDARGKIVLVFFGYTNCPDECPITMAKLRQVFDILGDDSRDIQVLLITTDPENDGPEQLKSYLANFHPAFLGLYGTPEELQTVWSEYGVVVMDGGETHSTRTYVIDRNGNLVMTFPYEMDAADMASDLKRLLRNR
jgi:protein SCO1